ncbi:MAG: transcription antitermination factor NusB [Akkermansiaceae bacterium]|nr:transcription antitermination factor NusB [Akkermansiaceae bacterium]
MVSRRQIREAVVQFLYCSDLEGGADPASLREPFWQFVTESDRRALLLATWKTVHHLSLGREARHVEFLKRLPPASAILRARPDLERMADLLDRIADLEDKWTGQLVTLSRIPTDDHDDAISRRFSPALADLFKIDRDLSASRRRFLEGLEDLPALKVQLDPVAGTLRRLERITERIKMVEEPEKFPEHMELEKIRESKAAIDALRSETDKLADSVIGEKDAIDARLAAVVENFSPERIDPVDRAILRLATWEILHSPEVPAAVAIDEAIELAKRFGTTDSGRFVNGILDRIAKDNDKSKEASPVREEVSTEQAS